MLAYTQRGTMQMVDPDRVLVEPLNGSQGAPALLGAHFEKYWPAHAVNPSHSVITTHPHIYSGLTFIG